MNTIVHKRTTHRYLGPHKYIYAYFKKQLPYIKKLGLYIYILFYCVLLGANLFHYGLNLKNMP